MRGLFWLFVIPLIGSLLLVVPVAGLIVIGVVIVVCVYEADAKREREIDKMLAERKAEHDQR